MPPLTLEQVLARSMRLPRQRAQHNVSRLFRGHDGLQLDTHTQRSARAGSVLASDMNDHHLFGSGGGGPHHSRDAARSRGGSARQGRHGAAAYVTPAARQEKLNFFELIEREDAARRAGRLSIHRSDHLVRNSADLTTFLTAAERTGDWEDGLRAFADATALPAFVSMAAATSGSAQSDATPTSATRSSPAGVNPNAEQIELLLAMCAKAEQWALVERIGVFFAPAYPEVFARTVELIAARATAMTAPAASSAQPTTGWRAAFEYVTQRCPLPAAERPVEAYNVCLRGCEEAKDWRGALQVVRAMGANPLQGWASPDETQEAGKEGSASAAGTSTSTSDAGSATSSATPRDASTRDVTGQGDAVQPSPSSSSVSAPPSPNVVSYATLIATLEQAGKDHIASEVLNRLPALEKEEITASYAALIFVWSSQVLRKQRRRF